jgi:hypothetical protein
MKANHWKQGVFYGRLWGNGKKYKEMLVKEFGKCYWCKREVKIYSQEDYLGKPLPDDTATLDHLKSKNAGRLKGENTPKVLSCRRCNEDRAIREKINNKQHDNRTTSI